MKFKRLISNFSFLISRQGQSLIEILVALGVGTLLVIAATTMILPSLRSNVQADKVQVSSALGKELLENVRVLSEADWHNISDLATSSANEYFLDTANSPFTVVTGTEGIAADGLTSTSSLVGYWKLDESTGTTAYDFSGNGDNGTLMNSPAQTNGSSCKTGGCLDFTGSNFLAISNSSLLDQASSIITVVSWIKTTASDGMVFSSWDGSGGYQIFVNGGNAAIWSSSGSTLTSSEKVNDGAWHQLVGTWNGTKRSIYVDGTLVDSGAGTFSNTTKDNQVGTQCSGTGSTTCNLYFTGSIDDVRVYNQALSATEIKNIYDANMYSRYFFIDDVVRDAGGSIVSSGGTNDPSTKEATVVYGWNGGTTSSFSMYLTRHSNDIFDQTDWSGGPGQDGPATSTDNMFSTSTQMDYSSSTGSIMIKLY